MKTLLTKIHQRVTEIDSNLCFEAPEQNHKISMDCVRLLIDDIKEMCEKFHDHGIILDQLGEGVEPSCPSCGNANAMIHASGPEKPGDPNWIHWLVCRDCEFKVHQDRVLIHVIKEKKNKLEGLEEEGENHYKRREREAREGGILKNKGE